MGRRPAAKTVRRTPHIRRRRVDEDERTLSQRIRRVDDVGFESESEQDARDAKFKQVPERVERNERGGGFGVRETQGNRGEDGCWKSGTLVEDDDGSVAKLLKEREMEGK